MNGLDLFFIPFGSFHVSPAFLHLENSIIGRVMIGFHNMRDVTFQEYGLQQPGFNLIGKNKDFLKSLPEENKRGAIKSLIGQVGAENAQTGSDLDETLVLLSRQAWRARNPRLDLF